MPRHATITVYYDPVRRNWDEAIESELTRLGLASSETNVICLPSTKMTSAAGPVQTFLFKT